jgi:hypothetical protein
MLLRDVLFSVKSFPDVRFPLSWFMPHILHNTLEGLQTQPFTNREAQVTHRKLSKFSMLAIMHTASLSTPKVITSLL